MYKSIIINLFLVIVDLWLSLGNDYYEILGVSRTADQKEIRRAFKKLAVIEHPDKNNDNSVAREKFILLRTAYETLKDPVLRKKYNEYGEEGLDISNKKATYHSWNYYANNFDLYYDDPKIVTLDETDYFESVRYAEKVWVINFYSPMCGPCHRMAPVWKKIAEELEGAVRIGAVNCEDDWQLCRRIGIRSYPTLMHYPKNSKHGVEYIGEKTHEAIMNYILNKLEVDIDEIDESLENFISRGSEGTTKPVLIFLCGGQRNCFTSTDRFKIAAVFDNAIDVRISFCDREQRCGNMFSHDTIAIYLSSSSSRTNNSWHVVSFDNVQSASVLIEKIFEHLPEPRDLDVDEFQNIRQYLTEKEISNPGWLICFYIGHIAELDVTLKRLRIIDGVKLGKMNCGKYSDVCGTLGVNRYPMWGILKPGGGFELYHGKNTLNDIVKFLYNSVKAINVCALTAEQMTSILEEKSAGKEAWFLDWYAPWCPPCMHFLREFRKASMEFDKSIVRFGTVDCTVHSTICHRYSIRSYPTAILINGTSTYMFQLEKTASNIVQFINEVRNPTVVQLTLNNFENQLGRRKGKMIWVVKYYAPSCPPCQRLIPEWVAVANSLSALTFIKLASVNCETERTLCSSQGIRSYPTIRLYSNENHESSSFVPYNGQRDSISMLRWITHFFPEKVRDLKASSLQQEVLSDRNVWVVDFFVPWCEHCQKLEPELAIVAQLLKKTIRFGRFNCDIYVDQCAKAGVKFYPTLIAYDRRSNGKKITDGFRINGSNAESIRRSILEFSMRVNHDEL